MVAIQRIIASAYEVCLGTELTLRLATGLSCPELGAKLGVDIAYRTDGWVPTAMAVARETQYDYLIYAESVIRKRNKATPRRRWRSGLHASSNTKEEV